MNALARIGDALVVLLAHFHPAEPLTAEETKAAPPSEARVRRGYSIMCSRWPLATLASASIGDLKEMLDRIAKIKAKHRRPVVRPDAMSPSITSAA